MAGLTCKIEGVTDLSSAFDELSKATENNIKRRVLLKAGAPMQQAAQAAAPERSPASPAKYFKRAGSKVLRRIGTLKILVQIGTKLTPRQASQARQAGKNGVEVYIGTRDPIGRLEERGTAHAAAHPFLRPAFEAHKNEVLEIVASELGGEIEKARERAARKTAKLLAKG